MVLLGRLYIIRMYSSLIGMGGVYPIHRCCGRSPVVYLGKLALVLTGNMFVRSLFGSWLHMSFAHGSSFLWCWSGLYPSCTAVITGSVYGCVVNHCSINIGIMNNSGVYVHNGRVILKSTTLPSTTSKTTTTIAVSIIYAAIKPYMRTPISTVEPVEPTFKAPIKGSP